MDIFTTQPLSAETKAQIEANKIAEFNTKILENMIRNYETVFNMFWNNPNASAQGIADIFGTNAIQLFQSSVLIKKFIETVKPDYVAPVAPKEFTINANGTVTIIDNQV